MPLPGEYGFEIDGDGNITLKNGDLVVEGAISADNFPDADLSGLTATVDELNALDGITATTDELNLLAACGLTAGQLKNLVRGVEDGYAIAYGVQATGAAQEDIPTGLTTVVLAMATMVGAPSMTHFWTRATVGNQTGAPAAGSIRINNTKPTASGNVTPTDATSPFGYVAWLAIGTA